LVAAVIANLTDSFSATFIPGETKIWSYNAVDRIGFFKLSMKQGEVTSETSYIWARYNGAPLSTVHDYSDNAGELTVIAPLPGLWVFAVHSAEGGTADFEFSGLACGTTSAGENCSIPVHTAFNNASYVINHNEWIYLRFEATHAQGLLFSVTTPNSSSIPNIFASRGQIPTQYPSSAQLFMLTDRYSADILNCNRQFCNVVRSIAYNVSSDEEWFVGIYSMANVPVTFGFWFNTSCVPNCETDNHGQCDESGRCECEIDFEGIDCSISKGLGPQYIVLIIIASLVVASAIIGFVAWAYMRRKRADYEIVS